MEDTAKWRPLEEGQRVKSEIVDVGPLPESFSALTESGSEYAVGIGIVIEGDTVTLDPDLPRYFKHIGMPLWDPTDLSTPRNRAIKDVVDQIVADYRKSDLFQKYPDAKHQLFGEISRRSVAIKDDSQITDYDDSLPHIDFVPPETLCRGYFFSDNNPTGFYEGEFDYGGNLVRDYSEPEWNAAPSGDSFVDSSKFPSGHMYVAPDVRTLVHRAQVTAPGERTFGRIFGDLKR